jgi:hypothetical protein
LPSGSVTMIVGYASVPSAFRAFIVRSLRPAGSHNGTMFVGSDFTDAFHVASSVRTHRA